MTRPRKALVSLVDTPYYHCVSRCVRRAFLCGFDRFTARSFEHRRGWIAERIQELAAIFAIDVAAYAVMSNHFHVVVRIDAPRAAQWPATEVLTRWGQLFAGPQLMHRFLAGDVLSEAEHQLIERWIELLRERLCSLSWFMRCLNEPIARRANIEDCCTGRFWEGRFSSQALLDEVALLTCMVYVDLNPIRAGIARTPETSEYTSIRERITDSTPVASVGASIEAGNAAPGELPRLRAPLLRFAGSTELTPRDPAIPCTRHDYLELVDWSGRSVRAGKRGAIAPDLPPLLQRLGQEPESWLDSAQHFRHRFPHAVGPLVRLREYCHRHGAKWIRGERRCALLYPDPSPA